MRLPLTAMAVLILCACSAEEHAPLAGRDTVVQPPTAPAAASPPVAAAGRSAAQGNAVRGTRNGTLPGRTEQSIIAGDGLSTDAVERMLSARHFAPTVARFRQETASDPDAAEFDAAYRAGINAQLEGDARLSEFACSARMCMGAIVTQGSNMPYSRWVEKFSASSTTPHWVFNDMPVAQGALTENRFVFTIDSTLAAAVTGR